MTPDHLRDAAAVAAVFGCFASAWFGWAQEAPPHRWRPLLAVGSAASVLTFVGGGLLVWRNWSEGTVFDERVGLAFGIVVGIEFTVAGLGAALLAGRGRSDLISAWIALVVGVHFVPVGLVLDIPALHLVAVAMTAASALSARWALARGVTVSAAVGAGAGSILLAAAVASLADALLR